MFMCKKKGCYAFWIVMVVCILLVGCNKNDEEKIEYADKDYLESMAYGLEKRWSIEEPEYTMGDDVHKEYFSKCVQAELDVLEAYSDKRYVDSKLQEKAISYINYLKQQEEALSYMQVDYEKYLELWSEAYNGRTKLIVELYDNYDLPIAEEFKSIINDAKTNVRLVEQGERTKEQVQDIMADIVFNKNKEESSDSYYQFEAIVENTTETDFEYFELDISLYDGNGVVVDTPYCTVDTWKVGQKIKFTFSTSENFEKYEINGAEWYEQEY